MLMLKRDVRGMCGAAPPPSLNSGAEELCPPLALVRADAASVYLRKIRDLAPPDEEGTSPACVDMRVRVRGL